MTTLPVGMDLSAAQLTVVWRAAGTCQVFAAMPDRRAWWWSFSSADAAEWDRAGTWGAPLDDGMWSVVDAAAAATGGAAELTPGSPVSPALGPLSEVVALVRAHPLAVITLSAVAAAPPVPVPTAQLLAATMTASGQEASVLTFDPVRVRFHAASGDWSSAEPPRMGLVTGDGRLLDGIHQPATFAPGDHAAMMLVPPVGPMPADISIAGTLQLSGPWPDAAAPAARIDLRAAVGELSSPGA